MKDSNWDDYWSKTENLDYWQKPEKSVLEFIKKYDKNEQNKVLDLGCGIGRHSIAFAKAGFEVTAFDSSRQALLELKESKNALDLDIKIVEGNFLEPYFEEKSFDIIVSYNVIYHGFREDFVKAIELCKGYLKPDGVLLFTCPTRKDGKYGNGKEVAPYTFESMNSIHPGHVHYFADRDDLINLIGDLEIVSFNKDEYYWESKRGKQFSSYWEVIAKKK